MSAFEVPENTDVRNYALREALHIIQDDPRFKALSDPLDKQRAILLQITKSVYEHYKQVVSERDQKKGQGGQAKLLSPEFTKAELPPKIRTTG